MTLNHHWISNINNTGIGNSIRRCSSRNKSSNGRNSSGRDGGSCSSIVAVVVIVNVHVINNKWSRNSGGIFFNVSDT